ncbi:hypothetical protein H5410_000408 [Solanum commersonii]|uniref:N-acetyltransferase ESCO acetyl-transferase domain-containing protein n=1 Tax=Solanum commersonii TaxID=4109 RepID=A0A9J6AWT3_SOLCO|nr:hypothetical protein H5410_000408 [Solanum commersonii]
MMHVFGNIWHLGLCQNPFLSYCNAGTKSGYARNHRRLRIPFLKPFGGLESFCKDLVLKRFELAFSQPTSAGKAFISSYTRSNSFLIYTTSDL